MTDEQRKTEINKSLAKPLVSTAGILGLIQGIAWTVFSVLCICCYCDLIKVDESPNGNEEYYKLIYWIFLNDNISDANALQDMLVKPQDFLIFMCFYLAFSVIWTLLSGTAIWAMIHDQWHLGKSLFGAWSTITILISIVDVVLTSLLVGDYITVNNNSDYNETRILVCYGIVMSLAARGYVLWVVNIIFAAILMKYTISIIMKKNKDSTMPIIHGYESNDVNPPWFNGSVKDFWSQPYTPQTNNIYENQGFERSQSFSPLQAPENLFSSHPTQNYNAYSINNNHNTSAHPTSDATSFSEAIRTATIGRNKGKRSPVNRVAPPIIPDPDYTPPSSPNGLKSVLRSKSNYL